MSVRETVDGALLARPGLCAVVLMIVASGIMSSQHGLVRYLASDIHPFEIVFFRNFFGLLAFLPWLHRHGIGALKTRRPVLHIVRAATNGGSLMAFFLALTLIPLVDATALFMTVPLFVAVGAMLFLGEKVGARRWLAIGVGGAGAMVLLQPSFDSALLGSGLVILAAMLSAGTRLLAKELSNTESPAAIVAYVALFLTPLTLIPALHYWQWPEPAVLFGLVGVGVLGAAGQLCFVKAYTLVDISFAEPMVFTRLIWAGLIGFVVFSETPAYGTLAGGILIVAGTIILNGDRARKS